MTNSNTYRRYTRNLDTFLSWCRASGPSKSTSPPPVDVVNCLVHVAVTLVCCGKWYAENHSKRKASSPYQAMITSNHNDLSDFIDKLNFISTAVIAAHKSGSRTTSLPDVQLPSSKVCAAIALYCYLKDCHGIRLHIRDTWKAYSDKKVPLATASIVANTGIAMIKKLSDDLESDVPPFAESKVRYMHATIMTFLDQHFCSLDSDNAPNHLTDTSKVPEFKHADVWDAMCFSVYRVLKEKLINLPSVRNTPEDMTLLRCMSQLAVLPDDLSDDDNDDGDQPRLWKSDYVYLASRALCGKEVLNLWLVFAAQIFWDTRCILRPKPGRAEAELRAFSGGIIKAYEKMKDHAPETVSEEIARIEKVTKEDGFHAYVRSKEHTAGMNSTSPFKLLSHHPMLCGLMLADFRRAQHMISTDIAGFHGHILAVAHLYNAARVQTLITSNEAWDELEFLIFRQSYAWLFGPNAPKTGAQIVWNARNVLGMEPDGSEGGSRHVWRLRYMSKYAELSVLRAKDSDEVWEPCPVCVDPIAMMNALVPSSSCTKPSTFPAQLSALISALQKDETALTFDIMALHEKCVRVLTLIRVNCLARAQRDYPVSLVGFLPGAGLPEGDVMAMMVEVLRDLEGVERRGERIWPYAVQVIRDVAGEGGDKGKGKM